MPSPSGYLALIALICTSTATVTTGVARSGKASRVWIAAAAIALVLAALGYADWHAQPFQESPLGAYFWLAALMPASAALVATLTPRAWPLPLRWSLALGACLLVYPLAAFVGFALA